MERAGVVTVDWRCPVVGRLGQMLWLKTWMETPNTVLIVRYCPLGESRFIGGREPPGVVTLDRTPNS